MRARVSAARRRRHRRSIPDTDTQLIATTTIKFVETSRREFSTLRNIGRSLWTVFSAVVLCFGRRECVGVSAFTLAIDENWDLLSMIWWLICSWVDFTSQLTSRGFAFFLYMKGLRSWGEYFVAWPFIHVQICRRHYCASIILNKICIHFHNLNSQNLHTQKPSFEFLNRLIPLDIESSPRTLFVHSSAPSRLPIATSTNILQHGGHYSSHTRAKNRHNFRPHCPGLAIAIDGIV